MVDALRAAHRRLRPRGLVIDARPDASRRVRIIAGGRVGGFLRQSEDADMRDARADEAIGLILASSAFRRIDGGRIWHETVMGDLSDLDAYVADNARYDDYERGTRSALLPFRRGPLTMRRAIKFDVLQRR
jgi:hypothetical protein